MTMHLSVDVECGMRDGVVNLQQSEGGSPGSPEMSFLYELGISSFIKNIMIFYVQQMHPFLIKVLLCLILMISIGQLLSEK